jgi:small subunit ribosomal protein S17e
MNNIKTMGRIKTTFIKRKTKELVALHGENFTTDFTQNKVLTRKYATVECKKIRNVIAGYMTRLKKKEA